MFLRWLLPIVEERLLEEQVIIVQGPRAGGKTTMVCNLAESLGISVIDFAQDDVVSVARQDPAGFVKDLPRPIVIDEYQRLPSILSVVKHRVDRQRDPGQFILTGSVTGSLLPKGTETLAGRSHEITLWGLSMGELLGKREQFIERAFDARYQFRGKRSTLERASYMRLVARGGFPEAVRREREDARRRWFLNYCRRVVDRDLAELIQLNKPTLLRTVLGHVAARTAQVLNVANLAQALGATPELVGKYLDLLEKVFLCARVPAFSRNLASRVAHHPKLHIADSGMGAALVNLDSNAIGRNLHAGALLESFVVGEIRKQMGWSEEVSMFHFRDRDDHEVDIVLETPDRRIVGVEVKSATTVDQRDLRGLRYFAEKVGSDFVRGIVFYTGQVAIQLGDDPRMCALPLSLLWQS